MHTDHPPTRKRAVLVVVLVMILLAILIGWMAYYSFVVVADAVTA